MKIIMKLSASCEPGADATDILKFHDKFHSFLACSDHGGFVEISWCFISFRQPQRAILIIEVDVVFRFDLLVYPSLDFNLTGRISTQNPRSVSDSFAWPDDAEWKWSQATNGRFRHSWIRRLLELNLGIICKLCDARFCLMKGLFRAFIWRNLMKFD